MMIWAILGARAGDNSQVLALAEALGMPFTCKRLRYNGWRHLGPNVLGATFRSVARQSRSALLDESPDLTISTGHRSVPVVQELRKRSNGRTRSIHIGYPRISPANFDLVVATEEYPIPVHPNLLRIPFALTRSLEADDPKPRFWSDYPQPRRLLILGGPTLYWALGWRTVQQSLDCLLESAKVDGGSVLVVGSPRTPRRLLVKVQSLIDNAGAPAALIPIGGSPSYATLLVRADSIAVTADSVAMISDAIATAKPVGLVPVRSTAMGKLMMWLMARVRPDRRVHPRDLRFFWRSLREGGLVGSLSEPTCGPIADLNSLVAARAKARLNLDDS